MAKFTVEHVCGHSERVQIYGKESERQGRADWMASKPCYECQQAEQARIHAVAAEDAKKCDLPEIIGTSKQVVWALQIRAQKIEELGKMEISTTADPKVVAKYLELKMAYINERSAAKWIDRRNVIAPSYLLEELKKELA